jgi:hypothetical protein
MATATATRELTDYVTGQVPGMTAALNPRYPGIASFLVELTEELCDLLLQVNIDNRPLKTDNRDAIERDLDADLWRIDGSQICLDEHGFMFDGQHRCLAYQRYAAKCRAKGAVPKPAPTFMAFGLPPEGRETTDTNAGRSAGDNLTTKKVKNAFSVSALTKQIYSWERPGKVTGAKLQIKVTNRQVDLCLAAHPEVHELVELTQANYAKYRADLPGLSVKIASYCLWLFSYQNPDTGRVFMQAIWDGAGVPSDSPILTFQRRLRLSVAQHEKLTSLDILVFLIKTWNMYLQRETATKLSRPRGRGGEPGHHTAKDVPEVINGPPHTPPKAELAAEASGAEPELDVEGLDRVREPFAQV